MEIKKLYSIFQESKHGEWMVDFGDYEKLSEFIITHSIKNVLELGGGVGASTAIIAESVGEDGHVDSVEVYAKCIRIAIRLIPKYLQDRITFIEEGVSVSKIPGILDSSFLAYNNLPKGQYDMVVIDGPGPMYLNDGSTEYLFKLPGGDFFNLISRTAPGTFFYIDGRKEMASIMLRFFSKYFKIVEATKEYTILMRTAEVENNEIQMVDVLFADLHRRGYFNDNEDFISCDK